MQFRVVWHHGSSVTFSQTICLKWSRNVRVGYGCVFGSRAWIRTRIGGFKVLCPTIERPGNTAI